MLVEPVEKYFEEKGNHLVQKYPARCGQCDGLTCILYQYRLTLCILCILFTVDSAEIDKNAKIPEDVMGGLRDLGLFGLLIPEQYGETMPLIQSVTISTLLV